jgi:transcription-repair coupling factor (superfamily II helicase)
VIEFIRSLPAYQALITNIRAGMPTEGLSLPRPARLPVLAALQQDLDIPCLFITGRADQTLTVMDELDFWAPEVLRLSFPEPNPLFYEQAAWGTQTRRDRLQAITAMAIYQIPGAPKPGHSPMVVASARALMTRTLPRRDFIKNSRLLQVGQNHLPDSLLRTWFDIGYQAASIVTEAGQYSRRGGILDIWPPAEPAPVRLDFFGDVLDTMRSFDPATQRTAQKVDQVLITPAREVLPGKAREVGLQEEDLSEFHIPEIHPAPASLLDYLPRNVLVLVDDLDYVGSIAAEIEEQSVKLRADSIGEGTLPSDFPVPYLSWSEIIDNLSMHPALELGYSTSTETSDLAQAFSAGERFAGRLKQVMDYLAETCLKGDAVVIVSRQQARLREMWAERRGVLDITCVPRFIEGSLTEGYVLTNPEGGRYHLLSDSEIFGWERPRPRVRHRPVAEAPESLYADLKPGDWVVHVDYGIGRLVGLVQRTLDGVTREFLLVEYESGDQLYVPVHQADRLNRYIGADNQLPSPTRLGTAEWSTVRERVREAVRQVAEELLALYARRQVAEGHAFGRDSVWQQDLEASFPYIETEDQLHAIIDVKQDMENIRPMDRLLCGDVGYGKTEVALRAAFKAVMDSKQVALLVPTTVLAQQHYDTFRQRLSTFPVEVEMLSRFRTARQQDVILKKLGSGAVDIVIGTHRLISSDVAFKDLGLVIIDEEQRFGVTHKEHLKKLRTEVDVLTLTATPIPRTLYMALTGVRDISTINTPPEDRLPIITHIGPYSPRLVRQAIVRELERGGQVFFVHNRVQTIPAMEHHLSQLVPEARVGVAHGQMHETDLAEVMHQFTQAEIDVLLCTSIIESGLDIPNANTLIVDRGDTFGLAQLYQLRGRVGRGAQRAYAYFFRHRRKAPTPEGLERLEVIAENTQLGAGYSIAMRDLEMRGAGELLGTRQHGYIASVGFHMYTQLLAQSVRDIRHAQGLPPPVEAAAILTNGHMPVNVDLPLSIGIPLDYVSDQNMRLRLYRRLANLQSEAEVEALADEFVDRFGPLPEEVSNLIYQFRVKFHAEAAGLASVLLENDQIVLRYLPLPEGVPTRNLPHVGMNARAGKNAYWLPMAEIGDDWQTHLMNVLAAIRVEDHVRRSL